MPPPTQANRQAKLFVPSLGTDVLLLRRMRFSEILGRPYTINIEALSERDDLTAEEVLGVSAYIELNVTDSVKRNFHGYIVSLAQTGFESDLLRYQLTIAPYLWLLSRRSNCRIFQNQSVPEIIKQVCADAGYTDIDDAGLSATYNPWEYCVQYRESDFNFISRLMEQEGIYYWLESATDKEVLKLADSPAAHAPQADLASMPFRGRTRGGTLPDSIIAWRTSKTLQPGAFAQIDYNPLTPRTDLFAPYQQPRGHAHDALEIFEFPGEYLLPADGSRLSTIRLQELHAGYERCDGETNARDLRAGRTFKLEEFPREDQNREYLVTALTVDVDNDDYLPSSRGTMKFNCSFTAIDAQTQFRSPRSTAKPVVQGPQTAFVVAPNNEEIQADEHARVRVKFHWDRLGDPSKGDTSCWIRVAQLWAGKKWGAQFMPRAGHEVIVEFLEGDPDRPIITGRVYNGEAKPPYDPRGADSKTMSTIKSLSSPNDGGFNELRFQDKKDHEQVFLHAQKRMDHRVRGNLHQTVLGSREEIIGHEDKGDSNRTVHNDINYHNKGGRFDKTDKTLNRTVVEDVVLDYQMNQTLKVAERLDINADEIAQEAQTAISLKSDTTTVQGATALNLKAGTVYIEGTQGIHLKCGGNFVVLSSSGVAINGTQVMINSGGAAQPAGSPLTISEPTIEEPLEAAAAANDLSGSRTGPATARTRTSRTVNILRAPEPPPPPRPPSTEVPPPPTAPPATSDRPCGIVELRVKCEHMVSGHARWADTSSRTLQIVPSSGATSASVSETWFGRVNVQIQRRFSGNDRLTTEIRVNEEAQAQRKEVTAVRGAAEPPSSGWRAHTQGWTIDAPSAPDIGWCPEFEPVTHTLYGRGCDEVTQSCTIQSFPSDTRDVSIGVNLMREEVERITNRMNTVFGAIAAAAPVRPRFEVTPPAGTLRGAWGWQEDTDWQAYFQAEGTLGLSPLIGLSFRVDVSLIAVAACFVAIPPTVSNIVTRYGADIFFRLQISGQVGLSGGPRWKRYHSGRTVTTGTVTSSGEITVYVALGGRVGSDAIVSAEVTAGGRSGIALAAEYEFGSTGLTVVPKLEWTGLQAVANFVLRACDVDVGSGEGTITIFDRQQIWPDPNQPCDPVQIFPSR